MNELIPRLAEALVEKNRLLGVAESCTGGWIARDITALPGSSRWFDCGFVTYSNQSKQRLLAVDQCILEEFGAVSEQTVIAMAEGVLANSEANISVATSGVAGPEGGSAEKPVGTVWFAWAEADKATRSEKVVFSGDREDVRKQAVNFALQGILQNLSS